MSACSYFFCGIGGSGMLPLAVLLAQCGHTIYGSDRARDQGKLPEKFRALENLGITLCPQDGNGVDKADVLVVSSAVEDSIPDVRAALDKDIPIIKRGVLLAELFNDAKERIAVAGTSGKSTVTGMIGTILAQLGLDPTVVNGGAVLNFAGDFPSVRKGCDSLFVAEMDESDGSINHYNPSIALLNNIALDHKSMDELEHMFGDYLMRTSKAVIINAGNERVQALHNSLSISAPIIRYGIEDKEADVTALNLLPSREGIGFTLRCGGAEYPVHLKQMGRHNVENALAALCVCRVMGVDMSAAVTALESFKGIHRRMALIGTKNGISVYDDFGHNPDKISASLQSLKDFHGRLIIMFQMHGFGPLKLMGREIAQAFFNHMDKDDILLMPEVYYAGGTVDRAITAKDLIDWVRQEGKQAQWFETRDEIPAFIRENAREGDRIVIMGARDDTLHDFAKAVLSGL